MGLKRKNGGSKLDACSVEKDLGAAMAGRRLKMKTTLATIALLMALTSIVSAQANHHWAAEQLANRTQMARDKIGIQCQKSIRAPER